MDDAVVYFLKLVKLAIDSFHGEVFEIEEGIQLLQQYWRWFVYFHGKDAMIDRLACNMTLTFYGVFFEDGRNLKFIQEIFSAQ